MELTKICPRRQSSLLKRCYLPVLAGYLALLSCSRSPTNEAPVGESNTATNQSATNAPLPVAQMSVVDTADLVRLLSGLPTLLKSKSKSGSVQDDVDWKGLARRFANSSEHVRLAVRQTAQNGLRDLSWQSLAEDRALPPREAGADKLFPREFRTPLITDNRRRYELQGSPGQKRIERFEINRLGWVAEYRAESAKVEFILIPADDAARADVIARIKQATSITVSGNGSSEGSGRLNFTSTIPPETGLVWWNTDWVFITIASVDANAEWFFLSWTYKAGVITEAAKARQEARRRQSAHHSSFGDLFD
jgi:hypothetical protein